MKNVFKKHEIKITKNVLYNKYTTINNNKCNILLVFYAVVFQLFVIASYKHIGQSMKNII